jgi:hypothetical protein
LCSATTNDPTAGNGKALRIGNDTELKMAVENELKRKKEGPIK